MPLTRMVAPHECLAQPYGLKLFLQNRHYVLVTFITHGTICRKYLERENIGEFVAIRQIFTLQSSWPNSLQK